MQRVELDMRGINGRTHPSTHAQRVAAGSLADQPIFTPRGRDVADVLVRDLVTSREAKSVFSGSRELR